MRRAWVVAATLVVPSTARALPEDSGGGHRYPGEPGSGIAVDGALREPDQNILSAPLPRRARDEAESNGLDEFERVWGRYRSAHAAMAHTLAHLLELERIRGQRRLEVRFDAEIEQRRLAARQLRRQTVHRYRQFLATHPDDAAWTPEVMFRLAELHVEGSSEALTAAEEAFQTELARYAEALEQHPDAPAPTPPVPDHGDAVELYRELVTRFPRFHLGDGALYMMGTLLSEMEEFEQSRQAYLALACTGTFDVPRAGEVPPEVEYEPGAYGRCRPWREGSEYVAEAWLRIGEAHYDVNEFEPALEAYAQVVADPEADLYDEGLIRMAWTLYLMRRYPEAAARFDEFVRYADAHRDQKEDTGALGLRDQGIKYLAKTYLEEDWDQDGRPDSVRGLQRLDRDYRDRGEERHVPEVYAALGDLLAEETRFKDAIQIWLQTLDRWPLAPAAPSIEVRVRAAYEMLQDEVGAIASRDRLATQYLRGTPWFYANEDDPEVIEQALRMAEEALVAAALDHHAKAQALRETDLAAARAEYVIAARAYEAYLERFPDTPTSYEYRYNFAEALYYGDRFAESAQQYALVRDSDLDNRLQEDAASGVVLSLEALVEVEQKAGRVVDLPMPKEGVEGPFDSPKDIPDLLLELRAAYDRFVEVRPDSEKAGTMMYLAGSISQKHHHFDDAQKRFEAVLEGHCEENVAINAGMAILDGKVVRGDLEGTREWTRRLAEAGCGAGDEKEQFAGKLKTLGNAVRFKEATMLYEAGDFEAAADRYVALVDEAPADPNADRALNNAAVAYENIGRFGSASRTYKRIYSQYPDSEFADDALLRTGFNHSRFFEFEDGVQSYLILAEDPRYKDSEHRETALWNAADLLDNLQEYDRSAKMFQRFADKSEDASKAADASFRAATVLGKTHDHRATIAAYERFVGAHGQDPRHSERVLESQLRIGQAYAALGNRSQAEHYYQAAIDMFSDKGLQPATEAADIPSEAQFLLAEYSLQDVLSAKITGTGRKLEAEAKELTDRLIAAAAAYDKVFPYRRIDWVLAAMYRRGYAFEIWAINARAAPVPRKLKEYSEAWWAYKDIINNMATQFEEKAIGLYEETIKRSQEYNIAVSWTHSARERLNIYKPVEYPLLRQPALDLDLGGPR